MRPTTTAYIDMRAMYILYRLTAYRHKKCIKTLKRNMKNSGSFNILIQKYAVFTNYIIGIKTIFWNKQKDGFVTTIRYQHNMREYYISIQQGWAS